jgi:signal transduction histidine kinase
MEFSHLRFSTAMLRRLGEELIPHADQGVLELVKNAYDADAKTCLVELVDTQNLWGSIRIIDDGCGMDLVAITNSWLVVGSSSKPIQEPTPKFKRRYAGNKGLGRLAALRLGKVAILKTRPKSNPSLEFEITIDWTRFDKVDVVEEVSLEVIQRPRPDGSKSGTTIEIQQLYASLNQKDVKRLARALILLSDPFESVKSFRPILSVPEFKELEKLVQRQYFDEADFFLEAELDEKGKAKATVKNYQGKTIFKAKHSDICKNDNQAVYIGPSCKFQLWAYLLGGKGGFTSRNITLSEVRQWLKEVGGVHLYHRGLRVHPYSDLDWLDMNLKRAKSPELRPSTNTAIGRVTVDDPEGALLQKTDRVGFVENDAFYDMKRFCSDTLNWLSVQRLKKREEKRERNKQVVQEQIADARKNISKVIENLPIEERKAIAEAVAHFTAASENESRSLREDLQLYRTLCTVGATAAAFAHQSISPLAIIIRMTHELDENLDASGLFPNSVKEITKQIRDLTESILSFAKVTLDLMESAKRKRGITPVHATIEHVKSLLQPFLSLRGVEIATSELNAVNHNLFTSRAALEAIFTNLIINSLEAFKRAHIANRRIQFKSQNTNDGLEVVVLDNGPGISGIDVEEVWLPGRTTTENGTGLGLTIVKDIVGEIGGSVDVIATGALGGAEFRFTFTQKR